MKPFTKEDVTMLLWHRDCRKWYTNELDILFDDDS